MAKAFGTPSNNAHAATQKNFRYFLILLVAIAVIAHLAGFTAGLAIMTPAVSCLPLLLLATLLWVAKRRVSSILDDLQTAAIAFRKGADGMTLTADVLSNLPDTYTIFHNATHPSFGGSIDHIVVGPTGVFALETKDWRGMVTLSGQGMLTIDGKHDQTAVANTAVALAENLEHKIHALSSPNAFVQAVMVFPHASVYVNPGTRSNLAVQRLDRLIEYIGKSVPTRHLAPQEAAAVARDLQALLGPQLKPARG